MKNSPLCSQCEWDLYISAWSFDSAISFTRLIDVVMPGLTAVSGLLLNTKSALIGALFLKLTVKELCGNAGVYRADGGAGSTFCALLWIDLIDGITLRDRSFGAFRFASATGNAVISNFVGHWFFPFVLFSNQALLGYHTNKYQSRQFIILRG